MMDNELKRKAVHISMVVFALCIGRLPPLIITICCLVAFLNNLLILPRLTGRALERADDRDRGYSIGMLLYPAVLLFLSLLFFEAQVYLAVAWGVMAFGDGFAGLCGRQLGGPTIPWNPDKRWSGTIGFFLAATPLTLGLIYLLPEQSRLDIPLTTWIIALSLACLVAALIESVPGTIDDNLVVPITAALVTYAVVEAGSLAPLPDNWLTGLVLTLLLTVFSIVSGKIDRIGGIGGGLMAWMIFSGSGLAGLSLLFLFFVLGSLASRFGFGRKEELGLEQENRGQRSLRHAISNGGVAAICGLLGWLHPEQAPFYGLLVAAALASATADTLSSELGNLYGRRFVNVLTLKPDTRGLDGVISLEGTAFGAAGALIIALIYGVAAERPETALVVLIAGLIGNLGDSVLGATLQRRGYMTNDTVNFANTLIAILVAYGLTVFPVFW